MEIGRRLQEVRKSKHMSVYRLSLNSTVSESHIRNIEKGKKNTTIETLQLLLKALNMTLLEFVNENSAHATYLMPDEQVLLRYYRTLPEETAKAFLEFCEKMYDQFAAHASS